MGEKPNPPGGITDPVIPESASGGYPESKARDGLLDIPPRRELAAFGMTIISLVGIHSTAYENSSTARR